MPRVSLLAVLVVVVPACASPRPDDASVGVSDDLLPAATSSSGGTGMPRPQLTLTASDTLGAVGGMTTLRAQVLRQDGTGAYGTTVTFYVAGVNVGQAVAYKTGIAQLAFRVPDNASIGQNAIVASVATVAGNVNASANIAIFKAESGLGGHVIMEEAVNWNLDMHKLPVAVWGHLVRWTDEAPLANRVVSGTLAGHSGSAVTGADGYFSIPITLDRSDLGQDLTLTFSFAGDAQHLGYFHSWTDYWDTLEPPVIPKFGFDMSADPPRNQWGQATVFLGSTASFHFRVFDGQGKPLENKTVRMIAKAGWEVPQMVLGESTTDGNGEGVFSYAHTVPSEVHYADGQAYSVELQVKEKNKFYDVTYASTRATLRVLKTPTHLENVYVTNAMSLYGSGTFKAQLTQASNAKPMPGQVLRLYVEAPSGHKEVGAWGGGTNDFGIQTVTLKGTDLGVGTHKLYFSYLRPLEDTYGPSGSDAFTVTVSGSQISLP